jgi:tetratricopeptide (TPR) repeat protein
MLLNWLNAREATRVGTALADDFVLQSEPGSGGMRSPRGNADVQGQGLQKFLQRFLQRVDREARPLKLNLFKRAKLANSFKWRLLEKGVEQQFADELTRALVLRLTSNQGGSTPSHAAAAPSKRRSGSAETRALHTRGYELLTRAKYAEALECYQELVSLDARDAVARNGLGNALAQLAQYGEAEQQFRRAIGIRPSFPEAYFNLAGVLQMTGRWSELEVPLRRALKLKPSYIDARVGLGNGFVVQGRLEEARDCYEKVLRVAPRNVPSLVGMGQIEALQGRFAEAEATYQAALEVDPASSHAWAGLVWLRKMTPADDAWLKRAEEVADKDLTPVDEATLRFAIGKYCDDVGDFARAFRNFQRANELHKMRAAPYNREARSGLVDDLMRVYTPEALARARAGGSDSARPVFVVGMPRSGTSLVEQIIASHPAATGAGELHFWTVVARNHEGVIRQEMLAETLRKKLAAEYLRVLAGYSADALRVIDKAPYNSDYLGLIHSVYPNARMIYLQRDPIDTCLSCYFQQFAPAMNYTMDLSDLAHYYREHRRLIAHWRSVLPADTLLEVPYAELVADQEQWTRRILEFLELPWDERCLDFHKAVRSVTTASTWQVRQKIYSSSVERWRNYKKFIGPLLKLSDSEV